MWLVHSTNKWNLKKILEDGELKPSSKTDNERYDVKIDKVFMSVIFDQMDIKGKSNEALIFFPIELMESYDVSHWSSNWNYGDMFDSDDEEDISIEYDYTKSAKQNVEIWQEYFYTLHPQKKYKIYGKSGAGKDNEVVFRASIPLGECSFIYLNKESKVEVEVPFRVDNPRERNKLLKSLT
jgi:hypothetical protein